MNNQRTLALIHADDRSDYNSSYYQAHKDWKKQYNKDYYQKNKQYWVDYYNTNKQGLQKTIKDKTGLNVDFDGIERDVYSSAKKAASGYGVDLDKTLSYADKLASGEMSFDTKQAEALLDRVSNEAADFLNKNKGAIANAAVNSLSKIAKASLNVGAAIGKEIVNRVKKSTISAWQSGARDLVSTGKSIVSSLRSKFGF